MAQEGLFCVKDLIGGKGAKRRSKRRERLTKKPARCRRYKGMRKKAPASEGGRYKGWGTCIACLCNCGDGGGKPQAWKA